MSETVNQNQNTEQGTETKNKNNNTENKQNNNKTPINNAAMISKMAKKQIYDWIITDPYMEMLSYVVSSYGTGRYRIRCYKYLYPSKTYDRSNAKYAYADKKRF